MNGDALDVVVTAVLVNAAVVAGDVVSIVAAVLVVTGASDVTCLMTGSCGVRTSWGLVDVVFVTDSVGCCDVGVLTVTGFVVDVTCGPESFTSGEAAALRDVHGCSPSSSIS